MDVFYVDGPLYTLQAGDTSYEAVQNQSAEGVSYAPLQPGIGYWAYLSQPTAVNFPHTSPQQPVTISMPAGQYTMIGNPFADVASVSGADAVYTYDPATGYQTTMTLQPGQGAFAYSSDGATITISPDSP